MYTERGSGNRRRADFLRRRSRERRDRVRADVKRRLYGGLEQEMRGAWHRGYRLAICDSGSGSV